MNWFCFFLVSYFTASNGRKMDEWWIGKDSKRTGPIVLKVLSRYLPRQNEENHVNIQFSLYVSWLLLQSMTLSRRSKSCSEGRDMAQPVSLRLSNEAVRVRAQVRSCGICGEQNSTGAGFLRVLRFPLPILIPPTAPHSSCIIRGWYNRPVSGWRIKWNQSHPPPPQETKKKSRSVSWHDHLLSSDGNSV
jgi:hypothetical protein